MENIKMFRKLTISCFLLISLLIFTSVSYSQVSQAGRVKAGISDIPSQMNAGETYKVQCTITNISQNEWNSEDLHAKVHGPFEVSKEWSGEWKLSPGESITVYYKVTAPQKSGSFKIKVTFYDGNKKVGYKSKKILVVSSGEAK
jgi:uncharacterized membrane protein